MEQTVVIEISAEQRDDMEHALGLNYDKKPTRNNFYCNANNKNWNDLLNKGVAIKRGGWDEESAYFRLTFEGAKLVYSSKPMSIDFFNKLR